MRPNNVKYFTEKINHAYNTSNKEQRNATLIEYIEYIDSTDKGYRVESKNLFRETIGRLEEQLNLKLISIHPTLDRTLIATYHWRVK